MAYEELVKRLRELPHLLFVQFHGHEDVVYKAADAIEELTAVAESYKRSMEAWADEAARAQEMMPRWIPVTEQLPEKDGEYLTRFRVDDSEPSFGIFPFDANVPAFGYWDECYDPVTYGWAGSDFIEVKGVTHWMPLPEPPKENGKSET